MKKAALGVQVLGRPRQITLPAKSVCSRLGGPGDRKLFCDGLVRNEFSMVRAAAFS